MTDEINMADGFFNRKRGRPPKNRFVQVYKNLQLPVAVFTSFKLERQYPENLLSSSSSSSSSVNKAGKPRNDQHNPKPESELDLLDFRNEKRKSFTYMVQNGRDALKETTEMELRPKCTIRSNGIYYPKTLLNTSNKIASEQSHKKKDVPEDLSALGAHKNFVRQIEFANPYLQMLHIIYAYYRTLSQSSTTTTTTTTTTNVESASTPQAEADESTMANKEYSSHNISEDCEFRYCRFRHRQTLHCFRNDCQYTFSEKSRFSQHSSRHHRLDRLLGTDFKELPPLEKCGIESCTLKTKTKANANARKKLAPHFHCLRCVFTCWEISKIAPHRRWHRKLDVLQQSGFRKVREECSLSTTFTSTSTSTTQ